MSTGPPGARAGASGRVPARHARNTAPWLRDPAGEWQCLAMLKHIVFWKLKDEADGRSRAENARKLKQDLESLRGAVPGVHALEVGLNVKPSDASYDVALYSVFSDQAALDAYQRHPKHQEIVAFLGRVRSARALVDYEVSEP